MSCRFQIPLIVSLLLITCSLSFAADARWSADKAAAWHREHGWLVGCNFNPSTAMNQLEMWQADTFDPKTIDRELGWAQSLGFNSVRVYLHDLLWQQDAQGYLARMDKFLEIADKHGIKVMFVIFDSVWDPNPKLGKQQPPTPHVHNSRWLQSPSTEVLRNASKHEKTLREYVTGIVGHFRNDPRIVAWDVWNEPDNTNNNSYGKLEPENKAELVLPLLEKTFAWARAAKPTQPLTSGVWHSSWADPARLAPIPRVQLYQSDVISFHSYGNLAALKNAVKSLRQYKRPLLCTEYMARGNDSNFNPNLGYLKQ